jgi:hypothetical protein
MSIRTTLVALALVATAGQASAAVSAQAYALNVGGTSLYSFGIDSPGSTNFINTVTGLPSGESMVGIDFRPATGQLYGLSSGGKLYTIDTGTGAATAIGGTGAELNGSFFGVDFNPTVDRIRVTSSNNQNLRMHPTTGNVAFTDINLAFENGDSPFVVASAYTNNFAGATTTTLYNLDSRSNTLLRQAPPNDGRVNLVGNLGVDFDGNAGFDIFGPNAYAVLNTGAAFSGFYQIDLTTGAATFLGDIGDGRGNVLFGSLAIIPAPGAAAAFGLAGLVGLRRRR